MSRHPPGLLLITDRAVCPHTETCIAAALEGGPFDLLLRDKGAPADFLAASARRLKAILTPRGGRLLIHDRSDIALAVEADGVHLPENGLETATVRRLIGEDKLLGRSCHDSKTATGHLRNGGDYVSISPVFATASHPGAVPLGVEGFARLCGAIPGPVLALGGIHPGNVPIVLRAGARGVAMIRGVLEAPDPAVAVRIMLTQLHG